LENYPPRNKHALETCWLRDYFPDYFPFGDVNFSGDMLVLGAGRSEILDDTIHGRFTGFPFHAK